MPAFAMKNANFPMDAEGRTYHVEVAEGQVANRIITVGDPARAKMLSAQFDKILFEHTSHRGFTTFTGIYHGVPISIVAIGMGLSMMDFFVREVRAVATGPLYIIRFGSCGSMCDAKPGEIIVADNAFGILRNTNYFADNAHRAKETPYLISDLAPADADLTAKLTKNLDTTFGHDHVFHGSVGCADSFYGSQGRLGHDFDDNNETLVANIRKVIPTLAGLEMEAFQLYHLAHCSTGERANEKDMEPVHAPTVHATCCLMVFADRINNGFITPEKSKEVTKHCSRILFETLKNIEIENEPKEGCIWEKEL